MDTIETTFDKLFEEAEQVIKQYNPCEVKVENGVCNCLGSRNGNTCSNTNTLCCGGCKYHTKQGCKAHKPLTCKAWICFTAQAKYPEAAKKLRQINNSIVKYGFWVYRGNKKDSLSQSRSVSRELQIVETR